MFELGKLCLSFINDDPQQPCYTSQLRSLPFQHLLHESVNLCLRCQWFSVQLALIIQIGIANFAAQRSRAC
jgi:hypothetical protein